MQASMALYSAPTRGTCSVGYRSSDGQRRIKQCFTETYRMKSGSYQTLTYRHLSGTISEEEDNVITDSLSAQLSPTHSTLCDTSTRFSSIYPARVTFHIPYIIFLALLVFASLSTVTMGTRVVQMTSCEAVVNGEILSLQPLERRDGQPRFQVEHGGWNYSFNPCSSYNLPADPHEGNGDQCHYVAMCKSRDSSVGKGVYFTLGIQRTARLQAKRLESGQEVMEEDESSEDGDDSSSEEEDGEEESSEEDYGEDESSEDDADFEYDTDRNNSQADTENTSITNHHGISSNISDSDSLLNSDGLHDGVGSGQENNDMDHTSQEREHDAPAKETLTVDDNVMENIHIEENHQLNDEISQEEIQILDGHQPSSTPSPSERKKMRRAHRRRNRKLQQDGERTKRALPNIENTDGKDLALHENDIDDADLEVEDTSKKSPTDYDETDASEDSPDISRLAIRYRGLRSLRSLKSYVLLSCAPELRDAGSAEFSVISVGKKTSYFELRHLCCCPGACKTAGLPEYGANAGAVQEVDKKSGLDQLWLVVVVNVVVILTAIMIGLFCCRKGGGGGPYVNMLPGFLCGNNKYYDRAEAVYYHSTRDII